MNINLIIIVSSLIFLTIYAAVVWAVSYHVFRYKFPDDKLKQSFWVFVFASTPALLFFIVNFLNTLAEASKL